MSTHPEHITERAALVRELVAVPELSEEDREWAMSQLIEAQQRKPVATN